jgi:hypothetical protein
MSRQSLHLHINQSPLKKMALAQPQAGIWFPAPLMAGVSHFFFFSFWQVSRRRTLAG